MPVNIVTNWFGDVVSRPQVIVDALPNQAADSTGPQVQEALGKGWDAFAGLRKTYDPGRRLLNENSRNLLA